MRTPLSWTPSQIALLANPSQHMQIAEPSMGKDWTLKGLAILHMVRGNNDQNEGGLRDSKATSMGTSGSTSLHNEPESGYKHSGWHKDCRLMDSKARQMFGEEEKHSDHPKSFLNPGNYFIHHILIGNSLLRLSIVRAFWLFSGYRPLWFWCYELGKKF